MSNRVDVVVVGAGPNGLAAAVIFAASGLSVTVVEAQPEPGGGVRTQVLDLGVPLRHDLCSAVHPMAAASPFFRRFGLTQRGVEFGFPDVSYAHPIDGAPAGIAYRSLDRTIEQLGGSRSPEGRTWRRVMSPLVAAVETVRDIGLSDMKPISRVAATEPTGYSGSEPTPTARHGGFAAMPDRLPRLSSVRWVRRLGAPLTTGYGVPKP
jgi:phytoene dehydrogenase-like protein